MNLKNMVQVYTSCMYAKILMKIGSRYVVIITSKIKVIMKSMIHSSIIPVSEKGYEHLHCNLGLTRVYLC